ncbi:hypothetical protein HJFPF1_11855 [Paramyrothecium foliicola]|nr:hypothetical protein HJFPF1_11855 [Paramyrothecium foliicola]
MSDPPSFGASLPKFESHFKQSPHFCYFHHIIDVDEASIHVEVTGLNIGITLRHERAKAIYSRRSLEDRLKKKTVGCLALVKPANTRLILAWAESGYGIGRTGDTLDAGCGILENPLWTRRAIQIGGLLDMTMASLYDRNNRSNPHLNLTGVYRASHVEVKLAVHAIYVLLKTFNITNGSASVTKRHLEQLKQARWEDGSRPAFEIYFSRKYCNNCSCFIKRLQAITGISIILHWMQRLSPVKYDKQSDGRSGLLYGGGGGGRQVEAGGADADMEDLVDLGELASDGEAASDEETVAGDVMELEMVDLTRDARRSEPIVIDEDEPRVGDAEEPQMIHDGTEEPQVTPDDTERQRSIPSHASDDYLDGLAYSIGQFAHAPHIARAAAIDMAEAFLHLRAGNNNGGRRPSRSISKPLPPTPVTEPPSLLPSPPQSQATDTVASMQQRSPRPYLSSAKERTPARRSFWRIRPGEGRDGDEA